MHRFNLEASFQVNGHVASMDCTKHTPLEEDERSEIRDNVASAVYEVLDAFVRDHHGSPVQDPDINVICEEVE